MLPNFLIVGTARAGTSSLYEYLLQHPDIFMCPNKEPMFFALEGGQADFQGPGDEREINAKSVTELDAYQALFKGAKGQQAVGEASTLYLYSEYAAENIHRHIPEAKIVAVLRDPVQRAYSSFLYTMRDGREPLGDFAAALAAESERIGGHWEHIWHYRAMGFYADQLERYFQRFGPERIHIILTEDLEQRPLEVMTELLHFLGVDETELPDVSVRYNQGGVPRRALLNRLLIRQSRLKQAIKPWVPRRLRAVYVRLKQANLNRPEMSGQLETELRQGYAEDVRRLQALTGRDLSAWLP